MNRIEEIKQRHERHKRLLEFGRSSAADVTSNKELDTLVFETKHILDKVPDDIDWLIEEVERLRNEIKFLNYRLSEHGEGGIPIRFKMDAKGNLTKIDEEE